MRKRRFTQVASSSDDEDDKPKRQSDGADDRSRKRRARALRDEDEDDEKQPSKARGGGGEGEDEEEEEEAVQEDAKPIGDPVRVSGKGRKKKNHYTSFEYDGNVFQLEDSVLLSPEDKGQKPYVAIIKDITQDVDGNMMVTGQWFYRPEEAEKKGGGSWQTRDTRELFYSFHFDDVPAESVMHKCVVHFIPLHKQLPLRSQFPGFIVQRVYDAVQKRLWKLTDKDYEDTKQNEIDVLVQKTRDRMGELPDIETTEETSAQQDEQPNLKSKWNLRRKSIHPIDVSRDDISTKSEQSLKAETPGSCTSDVSEYHAILAKRKALTGDPYRDKWLEKLLQGIKLVCNSKDDAGAVDRQKSDGDHGKPKVTSNDGVVPSAPGGTPKISALDAESLPDAAIEAVTTLEKVSYEALGSDFQKYNQKMRKLDFNLKNNALLARRLLNKELEPSVIINMSPNELKDGLTAQEKATKEPEKSDQMQMTDARCSRCMEKKVGVADIIQAGGLGDRYQLECIACGHTWYASRDAISSLTIDTPTVVGNVGTAPWATAKFENVAKKLVSPRESQKPGADYFHKSTTAYMPVLETQKSFNRSKNESKPPAADDAQ
ncbi:BAH domain proteins protein [Dioscorea alata]|uniref:BAH domain proteins protein n=2 Tax=Dioscorea alata TaxID=55571 RepID=A0ACB7UQK9_DIOAL|nr:BAH domain proteins protein [Dioscorea alata]KAH7663000.1 BAH domain proteins protein [Dioscorea alata]